MELNLIKSSDFWEFKQEDLEKITKGIILNKEGQRELVDSLRDKRITTLRRDSDLIIACIEYRLIGKNLYENDDFIFKKDSVDGCSRKVHAKYDKQLKEVGL